MIIVQDLSPRSKHHFIKMHQVFVDLYRDKSKLQPPDFRRLIRVDPELACSAREEAFFNASDVMLELATEKSLCVGDETKLAVATIWQRLLEWGAYQLADELGVEEAVGIFDDIRGAMPSGLKDMGL